MDRRMLIAGAAALTGSLATPRLFAVCASTKMIGGAASGDAPPLDLLSKTFPPQVLAQKLLSAKDWHPYPTAQERTGWEALPADMRGAIVDRAQKLPSGPLPMLTATMFLNYHVNGDRYPFDDQYFARRRQLNALVLAECVQNEGKYLSRIADTIWTMCEETFWGIPAHTAHQVAGEGLPDVAEPTIDLYTAEAAMDLAWTRYLVGPGLDRISPLLNKRIVYEANRRLLGPGMARDDFWWMGIGPKAQRVNNWNPWICSNWLPTLLLLEDDPRKRVAGVSKILHVIDQYLNQYPSDAGEEEGPGYWSRSPACYFQTVETLDSATGGRSSVLQNPFLRSMGEYIVRSHIAGKDYTDYGDAHIQANPDGGLIFRYGKATGSSVMTAFGAHLGQGSTKEDSQDLGRNLADLFHLAELRAAKPAEPLLRDTWYPELGFLAARQQEGSTSGFYLSAQTSNNGRSHGHLDSGNYIVYHDGTPVFIDLGTQTYTKTTFGKDRTTLWSIRSAFHNLPTIGSVEQGSGGKFRATDLHYTVSDDFAQLACNLATAYPPEAAIKQWRRTLRLDRREQAVSFAEDFELSRSQPVTFSIMTTRPAKLIKPGTIELTATGAKPVQLTFDPAILTFRVEQIDLKDAALHEAWGPVVYRILLQTQQPVTRATCNMQLRAS